MIFLLFRIATGRNRDGCENAALDGGTITAGCDKVPYLVQIVRKTIFFELFKKHRDFRV